MSKSSLYYHLSKTIFFRRIGDVVYVHNVATGEDFIFSKEANPILIALRKGCSTKSSVLCGQLDFLSELQSLGISYGGEEIDDGEVAGFKESLVLRDKKSGSSCMTVGIRSRHNLI